MQSSLASTPISFVIDAVGPPSQKEIVNMSVDREGVKAAAVVVALAAAVFLGGWFVVSGPAGMSRQFQSLCRR